MKFRIVIACLLCLVLGFVVGGVAIGQETTPRHIAFLARADNPVDALAASSVAAQFGGVVLLTPSDHLGSDARQGLSDYRPDLVILAGGEAALSPQVEEDVRNAGYNVRRVGGVSRTDTSKNIANVLNEYQTHLRATLVGAIFMYPPENECPEGMIRYNPLVGAFPRGALTAGSGGSESHAHAFGAESDLGTRTDFGSIDFDPKYDENEWDDSEPGTFHRHTVEGQTSPDSNLPPYENVRFCQYVG